MRLETVPVIIIASSNGTDRVLGKNITTFHEPTAAHESTKTFVFVLALISELMFGDHEFTKTFI
jgi:hypothetical protein